MRESDPDFLPSLAKAMARAAHSCELSLADLRTFTKMPENFWFIVKDYIQGQAFQKVYKTRSRRDGSMENLKSEVTECSSLPTHPRHLWRKFREDLSGLIEREFDLYYSHPFLTDKPSDIPVWQDSSATLEEANEEQKAFYRNWTLELEKGNKVNIGHNTGYVVAFINCLMSDFLRKKDVSLLSDFFRMSEWYGDLYSSGPSMPVEETGRDKLEYPLFHLAADAFLFLNNYTAAWETRRTKAIRAGTVWNFRCRCSETWLTGDLLPKLIYTDQGLTKWGHQYRPEILRLATAHLDDFHDHHGMNFVEYHCRKIRSGPFQPYRRYLFGGWQFSQVDHPYVVFEVVPEEINGMVRQKAREILRKCENALRDKRRHYRVGEEWKSETQLFYEIQQAFPQEEIVHHARPYWLTGQHLDIFFPARNLGIEYQGVQHGEAVPFFGGDQAFDRQSKLDQRKLDLCEESGCLILYVYDGYHLTDVIETIESAFHGNVKHGTACTGRDPIQVNLFE